MPNFRTLPVIPQGIRSRPVTATVAQAPVEVEAEVPPSAEPVVEVAPEVEPAAPAIEPAPEPVVEPEVVVEPEPEVEPEVVVEPEPEVEPEVVVEPTVEPVLWDATMRKAELAEVCVKLGLVVPDGATRAQILEILEAAAK